MDASLLDRVTFNKLSHDQQRALAYRAVKETILLVAQAGTTGAKLVELLSQAHVPIAVIKGCVEELIASGNLASTDHYHFRTVKRLAVD